MALERLEPRSAVTWLDCRDGEIVRALVLFDIAGLDPR